MVFIPRGPCIIGGDRTGNEILRIQNIPYDYYIDETLVTVGQYKKFLDDINVRGHCFCHPDEPEEKDHRPFADYDYKLEPYFQEDRWLPKDYFTNDGYNDYPIVLVDWWDAYAFAKWAGKDLPTELEWEKAARGIDGRIFPFGNDFNKDLCSVQESSIYLPTNVYSYPCGVSPYGCYDMCGNTWEWCLDNVTSSINYTKVLKGGSCTKTYKKGNAAIRNGRKLTDRWIARGFRCVKR